MGYELTEDYDERTKVLAWRMYLGLAGGLAIPWIPKLAVRFGEWTGKKRPNWRSFLFVSSSAWLLLQRELSLLSSAMKNMNRVHRKRYVYCQL